MSERTIVIVGAGLGAARAAVNLRKEGFDGRIVMLADEQEQPYERPPLSKDYLRGTKDRDDVRVKTAEAWAADGTEVLTGTLATKIDLRAREVSTADGRAFGFWRLLLATGAEARPLPVPGADLPGVLTLAHVRRCRRHPGRGPAGGGGGRHRRRLDRCRGGRLAAAARCRGDHDHERLAAAGARDRAGDRSRLPGPSSGARCAHRARCKSRGRHRRRCGIRHPPGRRFARASDRSSWPASALDRATSWPERPA